LIYTENPQKGILLIKFLVIAFFLFSFIIIAEIIYMLSKKEYLKSKSKYLRELINQKNNLDSPAQLFSSCVYTNWDIKGMDLSTAYSNCIPINNIKNDC
tara:strand:- start:523 stop:819 length:297 start_codon:yes stop_codon:yes gene_type:complete